MSDTSNKRSETFPVGIAGVSMSPLARDIPADEPPALPPNAELALIGKPVARWDARAKVTGTARYTTDVRLPGMLHARILRSPHPHARVRAIDTGGAERLPGVKAVVVVKDGWGEEAAKGERPIARYVGSPIAAVAALSAQIADQAVRLIAIDYDVLPFVTDMDQARAADAPVIFDDERQPRGMVEGGPGSELRLAGNVRGPSNAGTRGDAARGFAAAEVLVEGEYSTQVQTHCCLETHSIVADWRSEGLTVYLSTQFTAGVRGQLAQMFSLPLGRVRVIAGAVGGGFGSKSAAGNYALMAVALSRKAHAPVRLVLDRAEEQLDTGNRPATWQRLKLGARRDGTLTAISLLSYGTAGIGLGAHVGNFASGLYTCPDVEAAQYDVFINAGPGAPMRAPGNVQGAFAFEQLMDELAEKLGIDPLVLRDRTDPSPVRREERRIGAERIGWSRRHLPGAEAGPVKTGLGMAQSLWFAHVQTNSSCEVRVLRDGSVEVRSSVQDIGTGIGTILAQVVAEEFGLKPSDIAIRIGDTDYPAGPPSYGSRSTASVTPPARNAAHRVLQEIFALAAGKLGVAAADLAAREGRIGPRSGGGRSLSFREAAGLMKSAQISATQSRSDDYNGFRSRGRDAAVGLNPLGGVQFAEVTVDTETGLVRVERIVAVHDCGRPMNPLLIESQIQGGVLQGLSYALLENRLLDRRTGHMVNSDLEQYKLLGPADVPVIDVRILENYQGFSSTDAYGIAEPANVATAPAVANAVYNALGIRLRALPMNRAAILAALGAARS
jgi:xanthine dehydrogenase YagR molybdenum-binding subunit